MAAQLWIPVVVLTVALLFFTALSDIGQGQAEEAKMQLEEALRRASVSCYATEGIYPPTLEYLEEQYGIQIDRQRYTVHYQVFATNVMPDITVLEK
ncbi:MAG: hypothetical protein IJ443_02160 [Firmicutes bacterium]|nr:hypothetical protein [Bacillota bacterium]